MHIHGASDDTWTAGHDPGANTQATCTKAAAVGKRHVCTGLTVMLCAGDTAPTAATVSVRLINGATGGSAYLWQARLSIPAVAGASNGVNHIPCWIVGSPGTAMTLEFSAAGGAQTFESVSMEGGSV
jgi:hypothetical protein